MRPIPRVGKNKNTEIATNKIIIDPSVKCTRCDSNEFYLSKSDVNKKTEKMTICKSCLEEYYQEYVKKHDSYKKALWYLCRKFDLPFSHSAYTGAESHSKKTKWTIVQSYFKMLNSFGKNNNYGTCFDESDQYEEIENDCSVNVIIDEDFEVTPEMVGFWGSNYSKSEYYYLENDLSRLVSSYECDSYAQETLFKDIALQNLTIKKKRETGEDVNKDLEARGKLLGDANIKPAQESGANASDQLTYSVLIKKWENEEPIPEPDEEWKDVDGIGKYIRVWFLGHICKMMGITNEYSKEYEDEMENLRVNIPSKEFNIDEIDEGE